jgi:hypothetical protein
MEEQKRADPARPLDDEHYLTNVKLLTTSKHRRYDTTAKKLERFDAIWRDLTLTRGYAKEHPKLPLPPPTVQVEEPEEEPPPPPPPVKPRKNVPVLASFQYKSTSHLDCSLHCYLKTYISTSSINESSSANQCSICNSNEVIQTEKIHRISEFRENIMQHVRKH